MSLPSSQRSSEARPEWDLLLSAAQKNCPDKIRALVADGVDPSHSNAVGQSALHVAALWGHVESVAALLEASANVRAQNNLTGATPLHMVVQTSKATREQQEKVIDLLLEHGGDAAQMDKFEKIPLDYVMQLDPRSSLIPKLQPSAPALIAAIQRVDVVKVRELLEQRDTDDTLTQGYRGKMPVSWVVDCLCQGDDANQLTSLQILGPLLESGADPDPVDTNEESEGLPLYRVLLRLQVAYKQKKLASNFEDAARLLQAKDASMKEATLLLHYAAPRPDHFELARFLIEQLRIDVNAKNRQGMTPLQFAARTGNMRMLHYLLGLETIHVDAQDDRGTTALDAARVNEKEEAVKALQEYVQRRKRNE